MRSVAPRSVLLFVVLVVSSSTVAPLLAEVTSRQKDRFERKLATRGTSETQSLIDASGLEFLINTDVTVATTLFASGAASDATFTGPQTVSTSLGGTTIVTLSDAFDGYGGVFLNGQGFSQNGPAAFDAGCSNRQLVFGTQSIGNLSVYRLTFVPADDEFIRFATVITNQGSAIEPVTFTVPNNLGSDFATQITASSTGDLIGSTEDTWITTFQAFENGLSPDPRLAHVLRDEWDTSLTALSGFDSDVATFTYSFEVRPGDTRTVVHYVSGQPTIPASIAKAQELASDPPLDCLSAPEIDDIVNFFSLLFEDDFESGSPGAWSNAVGALR